MQNGLVEAGWKRCRVMESGDWQEVWVRGNFMLLRDTWGGLWRAAWSVGGVYGRIEGERAATPADAMARLHTLLRQGAKDAWMVLGQTA